MKNLFPIFTIIPGAMNICGQSVNEELHQQIENKNTPSLQYIIFNKDSIIYEFQEGLANFNDERKVNKKTTFQAFSTTKTFTALAIMQMVSKGILDLNESVKIKLNSLSAGEKAKLKHKSHIFKNLWVRILNLKSDQLSEQLKSNFESLIFL